MTNKNIVLFAVGLFSLIAFVIVYNNRDTTMSSEKIQQYTEVCASHILVDSEAKAKEILQNIKSGEVTFEECAKKESKCPSGRDGGNLGYFKRKMMVKEFEDAAFSAAKDEVTMPIKTDFGWHLIKVTDKR